MSQTTSDSIFEEIDSLTDFHQGWHYGEGDPVSEKAAKLAKQFHREVSHDGQLDVFPGLEGSVILEYFTFPVSVEVEVHPDGTYRVSREIGMGLDFDRDFYKNGVSKQKAKEVVQDSD